jgi:hypothetical protein
LENCYRYVQFVDGSLCDEWLSRTQVFEWFERFKEGRVEDDARPSWPCTSKTDANIERVSEIAKKIVA